MGGISMLSALRAKKRSWRNSPFSTLATRLTLVEAMTLTLKKLTLWDPLCINLPRIRFSILYWLSLESISMLLRYSVPSAASSARHGGVPCLLL